MPFEFGGGSSSTPSGKDSTGGQAKQSCPDSAFGSITSDGFTNKPVVRKDQGSQSTPWSSNEGSGGFSSPAPSFSGRRPESRPSAGRMTNLSMPDIPWGALFIAIAVIGTLFFLWTYQDVITAFLTQLIAWIIIIVVAIAVLKWVLFGK